MRGKGGILLAVTASLLLGSCGTLIWPQRQGQPRGTGQDIDWMVAALDGIGLLIFIVPGLVAFGVDFYTGAIFLPPEERSRYLTSVQESGLPFVVVRDPADLESLLQAMAADPSARQLVAEDLPGAF